MSCSLLKGKGKLSSAHFAMPRILSQSYCVPLRIFELTKRSSPCSPTHSQRLTQTLLKVQYSPAPGWWGTLYLLHPIAQVPALLAVGTVKEASGPKDNWLLKAHQLDWDLSSINSGLKPHILWVLKFWLVNWWSHSNIKLKYLLKCPMLARVLGFSYYEILTK